MVLYKGFVNKVEGTTNPVFAWKNVYMIQANDVPTALAALDQIALAEQTILSENLNISTIAVYSVPKGAGFGVESVNYQGTRVVTGDQLPLWLTVRVDFTSGDASRPERKYLRLGLTEDDILGTQIEPALITTVQDNYATPLVGMLDYVGPHGEPHTASTVFAPVQMRQQGWHRRFRPGFHRAYVPNA